MSSRQRGASRTLGRGGAQDAGPSSVGFAGDRSGSGGRRHTLASSASPAMASPGKAAGILKKRGQDDDGYLNPIKEDHQSDVFDADDSRGYSMTQPGDDAQRMNQSLTKYSDSRLEESLRDPRRRTENIPGLVQFLIEEHRNRLGIFTQDGKKLFKFWKEYVSIFYKQERERERLERRTNGAFSELYLDDQLTPSGVPTKSMNMLDSGLGPDAMSSFTKYKRQQARKMFVTGQRAASALRLSDKKPQQVPREGGILDKYAKYGRAHELDVSATITDEIDDMNDKNKSRKIRMHNKREDKRYATELQQWKDKITRALEAYYNYKRELALHAHIVQREKENKLKAKKDKPEKQEKPIKEKNAPRDPSSATMMSPGDLKSQFKAPEKDKMDKTKPTIFDELEPKCDPETFKKIESEHQSKMQRMQTILHVVLAAKFEENFVKEELVHDDINEEEARPEDSQASKKKRKPGPLMASTPQEVGRLFDRNRGQAAIKNVGDVSKLLAEFFHPYEAVLRLNIYKDRINTSKRRGAVPLHAFYLNTPPNDRLAFLFEIPEAEGRRPPRAHGVGDKEKETTAAARAIADFVASKQKEFDDRKAEQEKFAEQKKKQKEIKRYQEVFGESYKRGPDGTWSIDLKNRPDYTQPKDKWKLGRQLKELQKEFPHDRVLQRMIEEEFKANQTFKYPEEYDIYDGAAEFSLKKNFDGQVVQPGHGEFAWKRPDFSREADIIQDFKNKDTYKRKEAADDQRAEAKAMQALEDWLRAKALAYHEYMSKRGKLVEGLPPKTLRRLLAENYQAMINGEHGAVAKRRFPHISYGQDPNSDTFKQSYPASFKRYFFQLVKAIIMSKKRGRHVQGKPVTLTMLAPSRVPGLQDPIGMPSHNTKLQDFTVGQAAKNLRRRDPRAWRTRVFRRQDMNSKIKNVFMTFSEIENCTFEPEAGCLNRHWQKAVANNNDERMKQEGVPGEFFDRLGDNFCKAEPAIYKRGKLKKAKLHWRQGDPERCFATLCEGFNLGQLYQHHEPAKYKVWKDVRAHQEKKEKQKRNRPAAARGLSSQPVLAKNRSVLKRESTDDLNPQQIKDVKAAFDRLKRDPPKDAAGKAGEAYLKLSDLSTAIEELGEKPQDYEITEIEKKIRLDQAEALKAQYKAQIDQSQEKKELAQLAAAPIHVTYEMFLAIMTARLKVTLSDNELKAAFKLFDKDRSGSIDVEEFREVLESLGDYFTNDEIETMIQQADKDENGTIDEAEFVSLMRQKASKLNTAQDPSKSFLKILQGEISMVLQFAETQKAYKRMGAGLVRILDDAAERTESELKLHPEKKTILTEDVGKATFRALYDECWDLFTLLLKREEELERRRAGVEKRQRKLVETRKGLRRQQRDGVADFDPADEEGGEQDFRKIFKTIMCPLKDACPKLIPPRWPSSQHISVTKFGKNCPYAHHPMELQFPETLDMRIAANKAIKLDPNTAPAKRFVNPGDLHDCVGCGTHCNMCSYKKLARDKARLLADKRAAKKSGQEDKDRVNERKRANDQAREDFAKKFGHLKKASVLAYYGRANDAFEEIAKAAKIMQREAEAKREQEAIIQKEWQEKLGLGDLELPKPAHKIRPEDVTEEFLKSIEAGTSDLATLKIYIQQVCPLVRDQNDRNTFLNGLVEDLYMKCEDIMIEKKNTIDTIKTNVEHLGQVAELLDQLGSDAEKADAEELAADLGEDNPIKVKKQKRSMCEHIQKKKYYHEDGLDMKTAKGEPKYWVDNKYAKKTVMDPKTGREGCLICPLGKKCPHAHSAIELDWTPLEDKIKNLNGVIKAQTHQLKNDRPREPWRPSAKNFETSDLPEYRKPKKTVEEDGEDKKKPTRKGILDREDVFKKPFTKE